MTKKSLAPIATIGIDIGKNSCHVVGLDERGAVVLRQKFTATKLYEKLSNMPACLIGMEACVGAHHLARRLIEIGHDARLMAAKYVRPYAKDRRTILTMPRPSLKPSRVQP